MAECGCILVCNWDSNRSTEPWDQTCIGMQSKLAQNYTGIKLIQTCNFGTWVCRPDEIRLLGVLRRLEGLIAHKVCKVLRGFGL